MLGEVSSGGTLLTRGIALLAATADEIQIPGQTITRHGEPFMNQDGDGDVGLCTQDRAERKAGVHAGNQTMNAGFADGSISRAHVAPALHGSNGW